MSNFLGSIDLLDAFYMLLIGFLSVLAGLMLYNGNTANLTTLLTIDGFFVTLLTGKQMPSASTANLLRATVKPEEK